MPFLRTLALVLTAALPFAVAIGCSTEAAKTAETTNQNPPSSAANTEPEKSSTGATIEIEPNGPADTVRVFYNDLREKKFREALFLTNLRPAIEGLTDTELKEFQVDFEAIAGAVPEQIRINGEIISGDRATVTAILPDAESDKDKIQSIKLRREKGVWIVLNTDEKADKQIRQDGKNYLYRLRIETHQDEARKMLDRISKAEIAYSIQNEGNYADIAELVAGGLLPEDVQSSESTGYNFSIQIWDDKKKYSATATPAIYGKTGRLSFAVELDAKSIGHLTSKDNRGRPLLK